MSSVSDCVVRSCVHWKGSTRNQDVIKPNFENENEAHFSYRSDTSIIDNLSRLGHTLIDTSGVRPKRTVARGRLDPPRVSIDPGGGGKASSP